MRLTPEQQDWVLERLHVADSVARRYAYLLGYDDAHGTALEALCRAARLWDAAKVSKYRPNSYVRTTLCRYVVQEINKQHTGNKNLQSGKDPRYSRRAMEDPEDYFRYLASDTSPRAIEARLDLRTLFAQANIRDRVIRSFRLSAEGYPLREHDTTCSPQATKMRQQNAIRKMRTAALGENA